MQEAFPGRSRCMIFECTKPIQYKHVGTTGKGGIKKKDKIYLT